jgi:hypothetical protein
MTRTTALEGGWKHYDWTPLELFLAGVHGWKACLQQLIGRLADGK